MEQIKKFLHGKGFALLLTASLLAAAAAGVWAVRALRAELQKFFFPPPGKAGKARDPPPDRGPACSPRKGSRVPEREGGSLPRD